MGEKKKKAKKSAPTDALTPVEAIKRLNEKYCVVTEGGKVRVLSLPASRDVRQPNTCRLRTSAIYT